VKFMAILIRRTQLERSERGWFGYDRQLGGFFLVDRDSDINSPLLEVAEIVKVFKDKRGKEVKVVRLAPHKHKYVPRDESFHVCSECGETGMHLVVCPATLCVCGVEVTPSHRPQIRKDIVLEPEDGGKFLKKTEIWECGGCGKIIHYVTAKFPNPFYPDRVFTSFEELKNAILNAYGNIKSNPSLIPDLPTKPQLKTRPVEKIEVWEDLIPCWLTDYELVRVERGEVSDYEEQIYPSLNREGSFRRKATFYITRRWIEELTPESEIALQQYYIEVENWWDNLPTEVKVGLAAALVDEESGTEAGSETWVQLVGDAFERYTPLAFASIAEGIINAQK
jgi:hypothetical protein